MAAFNRRRNLRGCDDHGVNNVQSIKTPTCVHPRAFCQLLTSLGENDLRERYLWSRDAATPLAAAAASLSLIQRDSHYADGNHSSFSPADDRCGLLSGVELFFGILRVLDATSKTLLYREISRSENRETSRVPASFLQIHDESQTHIPENLTRCFHTPREISSRQSRRRMRSAITIQ